MKSQATSSLLVSFLAAIAFFSTGSSRGGLTEREPSTFNRAENQHANKEIKSSVSDKTKSTGGGNKASQDETQGNAEALLYQFLGIDRKVCNGCADKTCLERVSLAHEYSLEFMIATLPDPLESRLAYLFDRNLEAIQRAIESKKYVLDRFYFPWRMKEDKGKDETAQNSQQRAALRLHTRQPGVILYRTHPTKEKGSGDPETTSGKLLILFIVGEIPTSGVHKLALTSALNQIRTLSRWDKNRDIPKSLPCLPNAAPTIGGSPTSQTCSSDISNISGRDIRIIGPTFSGSEDSLELALKSWRDSSFDEKWKPVFTVISGSAQSVDRNRFCDRLTLPGQPVFHSTALPIRSTIVAVRKFLVDNDPDALFDKMAILKETTTVFGQASSQRSQKPEDKTKADKVKAGKIKSDKTKSNTETQNNEKSLSKDDPPGNVIELPFPLHISQLRNASEKARASQNGNNADLSKIRQPLLPLMMEDVSETDDVVPLFSKLEPASIELVLANLLSEIDRERVRYVGIVSTDVRDCIYLIEAVRKHCPNTTVFTFLADLLYLRPEININLRGTIVITPYPLFSASQYWGQPDDGSPGRMQFPSQISQGVYNATLALLNSKALLGYGIPFALSSQNSSQQLIPWVSIVGSDNLWPVTRLDNNKYTEIGSESGYALQSLAGTANSKRGETWPLLRRSRSSHLMTLFAILLLIVAGFLIPSVMLHHLATSKWKKNASDKTADGHHHRYWLEEMFGDSVFESFKSNRRIYLSVCYAILIGVSVVILWTLLLAVQACKKLNCAPPGVDAYGPFYLHLIFTLVKAVLLIVMTSAFCLWGNFSARFFSDSNGRFTIVIRSMFRAPVRLFTKESADKARKLAELLLPPIIAISFAWVILKATYSALERLSNGFSTHERIFLFLRAMDLNSGVSPLLPILFIGAASLICSFCTLKRSRLAERMHRPFFHERPKIPLFLRFENGSKSSFSGVEKMETSVTRLLECKWFRLPGWPAAVAAPLIALWFVFFHRFIPTIEGIAYDWFLKLAFCAASVAIVLEFLRFVCIWVELRRLLHYFSSHPLFSRPVKKDEEKFAGLPKLRITSPPPTYASVSLSVHQASRLCQLMDDPLKKSQLIYLVREAENSLSYIYEAKALNDWRTGLLKRCETQEWLAVISNRVAQFLEPSWSASAGPVEEFKPLSGEWVQQAESFLAGRLLAFLQYILAHMQNLVIFATAGMLLLLLAIASYPLQPHDLILLVGWLLILSVVITTLVTFVDMDRDGVLSVLSGSAPGRVELNRDFLSRVFVHGLLPILTLLSLQFPEALQQILSWFNFLQGGAK